MKISLACYRWNWICPACKTSKMIWTSVAGWQRKNRWFFCQVQFSHIHDVNLNSSSLHLFGTRYFLSSVIGIAFYSNIHKLAKKKKNPGCAVGYKNWLRITFAIGPSSLEDGLDRLRSFCLRHSKPKMWYNKPTGSLQHEAPAFPWRVQSSAGAAWRTQNCYQLLSSSLGGGLLDA